MSWKTKTLSQWTAFPIPLEEFLTPGDRVDEGFVDYLRSLLPPITDRAEFFQADIIDLCAVLEHKHVSNRKIYCTFTRADQGWLYRGFCLRGDTVDLLGKEHAIREDDGAYKFFDDSFLFFEECAKRKTA